eukprot:scaffold24521_cov121-Skeletonema_dohrnii-CCMP3373.AAC.1
MDASTWSTIEMVAAVEVPTRPRCHPHASSCCIRRTMSSNSNRGFVASKSISTHISSVCDDGCFDLVDDGGGAQQLRCQQDLVAIHMQAHVGADRRLMTT